MKNKILILVGCLSALVFIQTTVMEQFKIAGIKPDLFLVVVIVVTLLRGFYNGALFCIILGMTHDIISARFIGVHTLLCLLISLLVGLIHRRVYKENLFVLLVLTFSSTVIYEILYYFLVFVIQIDGDFKYALLNIILPESIYNAISSILVFAVSKFIVNRLEKEDRVHTRI